MKTNMANNHVTSIDFDVSSHNSMNSQRHKNDNRPVTYGGLHDGHAGSSKNQIHGQHHLATSANNVPCEEGYSSIYGPCLPSPVLHETAQPPSSLLEAIVAERKRQKLKVTKSGNNLKPLQYSTIFWEHRFHIHFVEARDDDKDDMLFFVRKSYETKTDKPDEQLLEVDVYRKSSKNLPSLSASYIFWEETLYLNMILQQFVYTLTCAVCTRTGPQELQVLKKHSMEVFASPSKRQMDSKGSEEKIAYPNIYFSVDNFDEVFNEITVRDSEMVCVELLATDKTNLYSGAIFLGSIRYDSLRKAYDNRSGASTRVTSKMSFGWYKNQQRIEFVRLRGPHGKGHAEMAVSREKTDTSVSAPVTPCMTPDREDEFDYGDFGMPPETNCYVDRRMSDPSAAVNSIFKSFGKHANMKKALSSSRQSLDVSSDGCSEVEASDIRDEMAEPNTIYNRMFGRGFGGQAWHWLKEKRRASSIALNAFLTYVTLPWEDIIEDVLETRRPAILTF